MRRYKSIVVLICFSCLVGFLIWLYRITQVGRHIDAGMDYANQLQRVQAEEEWRAAIDLDPENVTAWKLLGRLYLSEQNWRAAVDAFERIRRIAPNTAGLNSSLVTSHLSAGDEALALKYALDQLKREPDDTAGLVVAANLLQEAGAQPEAVDCLRRLTQLHPDDLNYKQRLAQALIRTYKYAEARPLLDTIVRKTPQNGRAWLLQGQAWFESDTSPEGLKHAEFNSRQAERLDPSNPYPHYWLGRIYLRRREAPHAVAELELAAKHAPSDTHIWFDLANAYRQSGKSMQADAAQSRFAALQTTKDEASALAKRCNFEPDNFDIHLTVALLQMRLGDSRKAAVYITRACQLRPTDERALEVRRKLDAAQAAASNAQSPQEEDVPPVK